MLNKTVNTACRSIRPKLSGSISIRKSVFVVRPNDRTCVAQDLFWVGLGCRAVGQTRPRLPKMSRAPSSFS